MKNKNPTSHISEAGNINHKPKSFIRAGNGIERRSGKDRMSRPAGSLPRCLWAIQPVRKRRICRYWIPIAACTYARLARFLRPICKGK